jgi:hypothetical protein
MDSSSPRADGWGRELVSALADGEPRGTVYTHLDELLRWLASPGGAEVAPIDEALRDRQIDVRWGKRMALMLLEELLFSGSDGAPHQVLGLPPDCRRSELRPRYRLLMRVYHPDRSNGSSRWFTERAERINVAYARARDEGQPANPSPILRKAAESAGIRRIARSRGRRRRGPHRIRRLLGTPNAFRRRFLFGVVIASVALVAYSCVANESWVALDPTGVSPGKSMRPEPLVSRGVGGP